MSIQESSLLTSVLIVASFLLFYTAYDKITKSYRINLLLDVLLGNKGLDFTLVELNKALSLSAMTIMMVSFLPLFQAVKYNLLWISMNLLWIHSGYSFYKFYQLSLKKLFDDKKIKILSIVFGGLGQMSLSLGFFGMISYSSLVPFATILGIAHFWTMEVDYKYRLQVRPYAYIVFPIAIYTLVQLAVL